MNEAISGKKILEQLHWRYAVKKFDAAGKISEKHWKILEQSLLLAPLQQKLTAFSLCQF